ncbi:NAD-dependent protein deacylase [Agromyces sp. NDB4Y10]|uniref:NAD-dependent deacylase n=1 Tax=Agromyces sp. NDB4Y10 TaxID=1775951 RepID=UPI0007B31604|nr:NAD-dependent deacylase [Agromyces sp. NDB4Y10]KZE94916.1 NAD-dependent protein deacylase [Agromyces sp. NDB4Y10]
MTATPRIVVLTGAGISAESGVPTFRDAEGLWEGHLVEDVATPEAFERDPETVHRFYDARRRAVASVAPNPAHEALARLEAALGDDLLLVTQNVDDLHERAGSRRVLHMHGELRRARCMACEQRSEATGDLIDEPPCPACGERMLRPDVVWFGEMPYGLDEIDAALVGCERFVAIGTSGAVHPAAGFVLTAAAFGAATLELNLAVSEITEFFDETRLGRAGELVPRWVDEVLAGGAPWRRA